MTLIQVGAGISMATLYLEESQLHWEEGFCMVLASSKLFKLLLLETLLALIVYIITC